MRVPTWYCGRSEISPQHRWFHVVFESSPASRDLLLGRGGRWFGELLWPGRVGPFFLRAGAHGLAIAVVGTHARRFCNGDNSQKDKVASPRTRHPNQALTADFRLPPRVQVVITQEGITTPSREAENETPVSVSCGASHVCPPKQGDPMSGTGLGAALQNQHPASAAGAIEASGRQVDGGAVQSGGGQVYGSFDMEFKPRKDRYHVVSSLAQACQGQGVSALEVGDMLIAVNGTPIRGLKRSQVPRISSRFSLSPSSKFSLSHLWWRWSKPPPAACVFVKSGRQTQHLDSRRTSTRPADCGARQRRASGPHPRGRVQGGGGLHAGPYPVQRREGFGPPHAWHLQGHGALSQPGDPAVQRRRGGKDSGHAADWADEADARDPTR